MSDPLEIQITKLEAELASMHSRVADLECTYDVDLTTQTAGDTAVLEFRSGAKMTQIGVVLS